MSRRVFNTGSIFGSVSGAFTSNSYSYPWGGNTSQLGPNNSGNDGYTMTFNAASAWTGVIIIISRHIKRLCFESFYGLLCFIYLINIVFYCYMKLFELVRQYLLLQLLN